MLNTNEFSEKLKQIMEFYNLSAASFAESIDVPRSSISHILSGRNKPSLEFILKLTDAYKEVELYWLLKGTGHFPKTMSEDSVISKTNPRQLTFDETLLKGNNENKKEETKQSPILTSKKIEIEKILVFYTNGTFKEYIQQK
jgi:transcriptional regulator with XRE-family HTH domain